MWINVTVVILLLKNKFISRLKKYNSEQNIYIFLLLVLILELSHLLLASEYTLYLIYSMRNVFIPINLIMISQKSKEKSEKIDV